MNIIKTSVMALVLMAVSGCSEDEQDHELTLPSNLTFTVENVEGSGKVEVRAQADNANFYNIFFNEQATNTPIRSGNGTASHTYAAAGTYDITVRAHATEAAFVTAIKTVNITLDPEVIIPSGGYTTPESYAGMVLVWQDEFEGNALNISDWNFEIGRGANGWGNNELQYYREENTSVKDGHLIITAQRENFQGSEYTSSRITTKDKQSFQYGRIDIRATLPKGQGIWPALWMLGANISTVNWPACGEIDIMEMIGGAGREKTVHGTIHWDNNGHAYEGGPYSLNTGTFADTFNVFSIVWTDSSITWYVNDILYHEEVISGTDRSELKNHFFFIFNVAVGGNWPGNPDNTTTFPQHMIVDYIRVFQLQ